jgi:hypothetical protein
MDSCLLFDTRHWVRGKLYEETGIRQRGMLMLLLLL